MDDYIATEYTFGMNNKKIHPIDRIVVCFRGNNKWSVALGRDGFVYNTNDKWEYDLSPSERDDDFIKRTRYKLEEALKIASKLYKEDSYETKTL